MSMLPHEPWAMSDVLPTVPPPEDAGAEPDFTGFKVEARDGSIGKVDAATREAGAGRVVVDTGPWIFGKKVTLPTRAISSVDWAEEVVYVDCSKADVEAASEGGDGPLEARV